METTATRLNATCTWITRLHRDVVGHNHLLEIRLLEKSARHDFIIARHRLSNNIFSYQLLESS